MEPDHAHNSRLLAAFLAELAAFEAGDIRAVLRTYCHQDVVWEVFHPFNTMHGVDHAAERFGFNVAPLAEVKPPIAPERFAYRLIPECTHRGTQATELTLDLGGLGASVGAFRTTR